MEYAQVSLILIAQDYNSDTVSEREITAAYEQPKRLKRAE